MSFEIKTTEILLEVEDDEVRVCLDGLDEGLVYLYRVPGEEAIPYSLKLIHALSDYLKTQAEKEVENEHKF